MNLLPSINSSIHSIKVDPSNYNYIVDFTYKLFISNNNKLPDVKNENFANKTLISRNFWGELINRYWQETIFLSKSDSLSEKYVNQLKSDGLSIYGNQYKKFLFEFSKALMIGRISTSLNNNSYLDTAQNNSTDVKYVWRKTLNLPVREKHLTSTRQDYISRQKILLIKKLQYTNFPIFTVANNFNQIIIAEPSENLVSYNNPLNNIYLWYHNQILSQTNKKPIHEALFFINLEDALEYKKYISNKYLKLGIYTNEDKLKVIPSRLDFYYRLVCNTHPQVYFRLIPDLKELGELLYTYQYSSNVNFHKDQEYGKHHFQGQPIYIIQPIQCKNNVTQRNDLVTYKYLLHENRKNFASEYQAVFMNYKVALLAWRKFTENHKDYNLPKQPEILVYNLEDFLNNCLSQDNLDVLFVPNQDSYRFIQLLEQQKSLNYMWSDWHNKISYIKSISKRLIWSLTSKQPINL